MDYIPGEDQFCSQLKRGLLIILLNVFDEGDTGKHLTGLPMAGPILYGKPGVSPAGRIFYRLVKVLGELYHRCIGVSAHATIVPAQPALIPIGKLSVTGVAITASTTRTRSSSFIGSNHRYGQPE
jgi:hypothetical protein